MDKSTNYSCKLNAYYIEALWMFLRSHEVIAVAVQ